MVTFFRMDVYAIGAAVVVLLVVAWKAPSLAGAFALPLEFVSACILTFVVALGRFGFGFRLGVAGLAVAVGMGLIAAVQMWRRRPRPTSALPRARAREVRP